MKLIFAMTDNNEYGAVVNGKDTLPWAHGYLVGDLPRFKELTSGSETNIVVMGRKTFESLLGLLPNREHFVLTRTPENYQDDSDSSLVSYFNLANLARTLTTLSQYSDVNISVIGGPELIKALLLYIEMGRCPGFDQIHLTISRETELVEGEILKTDVDFNTIPTISRHIYRYVNGKAT